MARGFFNGLPGDDFGYIDLGDHAIPAVNGYATIIQHPLAGFKQIALTDNQFKVVFGDVAQYITDTEPGSSGSCVFDDRWRLVALHHAGGDLSDPTNPGKTHFINEGILINRIITDAQELINLPDLLPDLVFGDLRPILTIAVSSNEILTPLMPALTGNDGFVQAINRWILLQKPSSESDTKNNEIAPVLLAVVAGTVAGAAIRHWGHKNETFASGTIKNGSLRPYSKIFIDLVRPLNACRNPSANSESANDIRLPKDLVRLIADTKAGVGSARHLYNSLITKVDQLKGMVSGIANSIGGAESTLEVLPVLAVAFLAGVAAGARAYDGKF